MRPKSLAGSLVTIHNLFLGGLWAAMLYSVPHSGKPLFDEHGHCSDFSAVIGEGLNFVFMVALFGAVIVLRLPIREREALAFWMQTIAAALATCAMAETLRNLPGSFRSCEMDLMICLYIFCATIIVSTIACAVSVWYRYWRDELG